MKKKKNKIIFSLLLALHITNTFALAPKVKEEKKVDKVKSTESVTQSSSESKKNQDNASKNIDCDTQKECSCKNTNFNPDFSPIVEKILPSIVNISTTQIVGGRNPLGGGGMLEGMPPRGAFGGSIFEDILRDLLEGGSKAYKKVQSLGSGFVIKKTDQSIQVVTNNHVIADGRSIKIFIHNKIGLEAKVIASDERSDIAVLEANIEKLSPEMRNNIAIAQWGDSNKAAPGNIVLAFGTPFNLEKSVTMGIISFIGRYIPNSSQHGPSSYDVQYIQHSAQINLGNSGGCLVGTNGKIIGINTAIFSPSGGNIGIGFAIPSNYAQHIIKQLLDHGYIKRGSLGIQIQPFTTELRESMGKIPLDENITLPIVSRVDENGPSTKKLKVGDIIVAFDGKKIQNNIELPSLVASTEVGKTICVKVLRNAKGKGYKEIDIHIKIGEMKNDHSFEVTKNSKESEIVDLELIGLKVSALPKSKNKADKEKPQSSSGVVVVDVKMGKFAHEAGLIRGDEIETVYGQSVESPEHLQQIVENAVRDKKESIVFYIKRHSPPNTINLFLSVNLKDELSNGQESTKKNQD
jgi:serine protease Do